ncbi:hypothetical protein DL96DRAFT_1819055 [Flagelloscypha sp. PMI_526]|nr:hypothetical protein DL96DRAFT_1819055 [Flagelloscypha sp. PMI_526]
MSRVRIPNEMLHEILRQFEDLKDTDNVTTLLSAALAARLFLEPCRRLLYSGITVYYHETNRGYGQAFLDFPSCLDFLQAHPHLARHSTTLTVARENWNDEVPVNWEEASEGDIHLLQICALLPNLKSASLRGGHTLDIFGEHIGLAILNSLPPSIRSLQFDVRVMFATTTQFLLVLSRFTNLTSLKLEGCTVANGDLWDSEQTRDFSRSHVSPIRYLVTFWLSSILERDLIEYLLHPESPHPAQQLRQLHTDFKDEFLLKRLLDAQTSSHLQSLEIRHATEYDKQQSSIFHQRPVEFTSLKRFTALQHVDINNLLLTDSIRWILDLIACDDMRSGARINITLSFGTCSSTDTVYDPEEWKTLDSQLSYWSSLELLTLSISPSKFGEETLLPLMEKLMKAEKVVVPAPYCECCDYFADGNE